MPAKGSGGFAECHPNEKHYCKTLCKRCYGRLHYKNNQEHRLEVIKQCWTRRKLEQYGQSNWGTRCEVCDVVGKMSLDHNHATNKFRGWLCQPCNMALGLLKDNPQRIERLRNYILDNQ